MTETEELPIEQKTIKRMKSRVQDTQEVVWPRETGNIITDTAIILPDLSAQFKFQGHLYDVRSPDKRLMDRFKVISAKEEEGTATPEENEEGEKLQKQVILDMIPSLDMENQRIGELEYDYLAIACWEYYSFLKLKLRASTRERTLQLKDTLSE